MDIKKTSLPEMYSQGLLNEHQKKFPVGEEYKIFDVVFNGITKVLGMSKNEEHPVVFRIERLDSSLVFAGCVQYVASKDKKNPGSWNLSWLFNEDDIPNSSDAVPVVFRITDPQVQNYFKTYAVDKYGILFNSVENLVTLITYAGICLRNWLDENAKEDEEISIELDGVFKATVNVDNKEKVFGLEVFGETAAKAKEDTAVEK